MLIDSKLFTNQTNEIYKYCFLFAWRREDESDTEGRVKESTVQTTRAHTQSKGY